jgi:hypothetical protein
MQIHSLKLTFQDIVTKDVAKIAVVNGTLFIDTGKTIGDTTEPEFETINFTTAMSRTPALKNAIQELIMEAVTLKNLKIAKENGNLTHFLEASGVQTKPIPVKRVSKTRKKK